MSTPISMPLSDRIVSQLRAGDYVTLTGIVYAACVPVHRQLVDAVRQGEGLPFELEGNVICFVDQAIPENGVAHGIVLCDPPGADQIVRQFLSEGVRGFIGHRTDSASMKYSYRKYRAVHFSPRGDITEHVETTQVAVDEGLGVILMLTLRDLPVVVASDLYGGDTTETLIDAQMGSPS